MNKRRYLKLIETIAEEVDDVGEVRAKAILMTFTAREFEKACLEAYQYHNTELLEKAPGVGCQASLKLALWYASRKNWHHRNPEPKRVQQLSDEEIFGNRE